MKQELMDRQQLNMLNECTATHISGTAIDLSMASPEITPDCYWQVYGSVLNSDHFLIILTIAKPPNQAPVQPGRFNFKKVSWQQYTRHEAWQDFPRKEQNTPVEILVDDLYERFYTAAEHSVPKYIPRRYYPKPWWSRECTRVWTERKRLYRRWKITGERNDKIRWKRARAVATRSFKLTKQNEFMEYISGMKINTPAQQIFEKLQKIRRREARRIIILQKNGRLYTTTQEIVECLAEAFHEVSNSNNYSQEFLAKKCVDERTEICLPSDNSETYNKEFTISELNLALQHASNT